MLGVRCSRKVKLALYFFLFHLHMGWRWEVTQYISIPRVGYVLLGVSYLGVLLGMRHRLDVHDCPLHI